MVKDPVSPILVREAQPEDDTRIGDLLVQAFVESYARKLPDVVVSEARKADLRNIAPKRETGRVLVACPSHADADKNGDGDHGKILGTVSVFRPGDPTTRAWAPGMADLRYLAIDPAHHKQGLSTPLIQAALDTARGWGASSVGLHVRHEALGVAEVYLRHGFKRVPEGDCDLLPEIYLDAFKYTL